MTQQQKNKRLLVVLVVLVVAILATLLTEKKPKGTISDPFRFALSDTSAVTSIQIIDALKTIELERRQNGWFLSSGAQVDEGIMMVVLTVMQQTEISRRVSANKKESVVQLLKESGKEVKIFADKTLMQHFFAGGNPNKTQSYFMTTDDEPFVVSIPGYESYVAGIFEIPEIDWQSRLLVSSTWRSLLKLSASYPEQPDKDFEIVFNNQFLDMPGITELDTAAMVNYLEQFEYFQADRFADTESQTMLDSAAAVQLPMLIVKIEDIDASKTLSIQFYPHPTEANTVLGMVSDGRYALFNRRRLAGVFKEKSDFMAR
ncbi:MAG: hypothetical protein ACFCUU_09640 [Cyclobacteriaceae bacterium]